MVADKPPVMGSGTLFWHAGVHANIALIHKITKSLKKRGERAKAGLEFIPWSPPTHFH